MTLSSNRIIKLKQPVTRVKVISHTSRGNLESGEKKYSEENPATKEFIRISQSDFQKEIQYAYKKGLEEGRLDGYHQAENDYNHKFEQLLVCFDQIQVERTTFFQKAERALLELVLKMVEKILKEVPPFMPELIEKNIQNLLRMLANETVVEIFLNPEDLKNFQELKSSFEKSLPGLEKISLKSDPRITRGGCLLNTDVGKIDARIETQISQLLQEIRKAFQTTDSTLE
ncbi:MAG: FliH/SctL family protein [Calditrichia bacterium]